MQESRAVFSKSDAQPVFDFVLAKKLVELLETERDGEQNAKGRGLGSLEGSWGVRADQVCRWYLVRDWA